MVGEQGLNVRQVEAKVREMTMRKAMDAASPDPKLIAIESELRGRLGTQVKIQRQGMGGKILIDFFSEDELNDIINKISEHRDQIEGGYFTVYPSLSFPRRRESICSVTWNINSVACW